MRLPLLQNSCHIHSTWIGWFKAGTYGSYTKVLVVVEVGVVHGEGDMTVCMLLQCHAYSVQLGQQGAGG